MICCPGLLPHRDVIDDGRKANSALVYDPAQDLALPSDYVAEEVDSAIPTGLETKDERRKERTTP